jgi:hypothetical protein
MKSQLNRCRFIAHTVVASASAGLATQMPENRLF